MIKITLNANSPAMRELHPHRCQDSDDQFKHFDSVESNSVILCLTHSARLAEIPLLTYDFSERMSPIRRPAQEERTLACACFPYPRKQENTLEFCGHRKSVGTI